MHCIACLCEMTEDDLQALKNSGTHWNEEPICIDCCADLHDPEKEANWKSMLEEAEKDEP